MDVCPL